MTTFNFTVRKTARGEYTIFSEKGYLMCVLDRCESASEASDRAGAWASSWGSVSVKVEEDDKQSG